MRSLVSRLVRGSSFRSASSATTAFDNWLSDVGTGRTTSAGMNVTPRTAVSFPPLWRAMNILSNDQLRVPMMLKFLEPDGGKRPDPKHPAYQIVKRKAAPYLLSGTLRAVLQYHAGMMGNGYAYVFRDQRARPIELLPLDPRYTFPVVEITWTSRRVYYVTSLPMAGNMADGTMSLSPSGGELRKLPSEDVIHVKGLSFDGLIGHSVVDLLADSIGLGLAGNKFASLYFSNGGKAGGFLVHPQNLTKEQIKAIRETWSEMKPGIDGAHKPGVLFGGMDWKQTTIDPDKAQALESRKYSIIDISNITGVRPHDIGDQSRSGYNGIQAENDSHLRKTMLPWYSRFVQEFEDKLLTEKQKETESHCIEYDTNVMEVADLQSQAESDKKGREMGVFSPNDVRRRQGMELIPAADGGDDRHIPMNWMKLGSEPPKKGKKQAENDQNQPENDPKTTPKQRAEAVKQQAALHDLIVATASRLSNVEISKLVEASKDPKTWLNSVENTLTQLAPKWQDAMQPVVRVCGRDNAAEATSQLVQSHVSATRERLVALADCSAADLPSRVDQWAANYESDEPLRLALQVLGV